MLKGIREFLLGPDKTDEDEMIEIRFEDLAPLWLRYNAGFVPAVSTPDPEFTDADIPSEDASVLTDTDTTHPIENPATSTTEVAPATTPTAASPVPPGQAPKRPAAKPSEVVKKKEQTPILDVSNVLYRDIIEPHKNHFESQGCMPGISKLFELLDKHGDCSSVVTDASYKDVETTDLYSVADTLMKISVKNHSYRVAKVAMKLLKEQYRDYEIFVPKTLTAALGHDIGKIPALRTSGLYAKADHPLVSAAKVAELFLDCKDIFWLNQVLDAIKNHHRSTEDQFTSLLKQADHMARELELAENNKEFAIQAWEDWFKIESVLAMVVPHINVIQTGNMWHAFSFGSTVYCQPDFLYELTKKLGAECKVIDMTITLISEKEVALRKVTSALRQKSLLSFEIGEGYYGKNFDITMEKHKRKFYLIPVKIEAFGVPPHDIERVKEGYLQIVKDVTVSKR